MTSLKYSSAFFFVPLVLASILVGGWIGFATPLVAFGLIPLMELFFKGSEENLDDQKEQAFLEDSSFSVIVYLLSLTHIGMFLLYLWKVSTGSMDTMHFVGATWSVGIACGAYGINVAHELGHRKNKWEQRLSKSLLLTSMYMHFFIEHNRGHHANVATENDPASARHGESLYAFWLRSVIGGYLSAWKIEAKRLSRKDKAWWHPSNEMLQLQVLQVVAWLLVGFLLGPVALGAYFIVATIGILLLETINYIEHYGLQRERKENGRFETVLPIHSWNSNHPIGRIILFELTRHSDHHAHASRRYQVLRHFDESPQLPTGYPGMMLLAFFPPLFFQVMHKQISKYQGQQELDNLSQVPASS